MSRGRLESLNIGLHRGDAPENVLENYRILGAALGFAPEDTVLTKQVHGDVVLRVGRKDRGTGLFVPQETPCDGLITNEPGVALVIFTADCTPILFHDPVTGAVGAVHAGWRGTAAQIGARAVEAMAAAYGCKPENIRAAIGPNIGKCCFETHGDVPQAMEAALGRAVAPISAPVGTSFMWTSRASMPIFSAWPGCAMWTSAKTVPPASPGGSGPTGSPAATGAPRAR